MEASGNGAARQGRRDLARALEYLAAAELRFQLGGLPHLSRKVSRAYDTATRAASAYDLHAPSDRQPAA